MERNRESGRRSSTVAAANGLARRRHSRTNSHRDSPEEEEVHDTGRLRDRGSGKKDRDRLGKSKRRRGDRLMHAREDGGEDTSEDSINDEPDDEEDDDDENDDRGGGVSVRMVSLGPNTALNRKSFPPAKVFRPTWKAADEMIGVSVPRKARSASTKRSHECWASAAAIVADPNHRQPSASPVRTTAPASVASPASPSSSNASVRKKIKPNGGKFRPPKSSSKPSSSAQEEIEIEIAEVLYGMMTQPQGPSNNEGHKSSTNAKSRISSPISNSQSAPLPPQNSTSSVTPMSVIAPKRKKPRPVKCDEENPTISTVRSSPISMTTKAENGQPSKVETCSQNLDKNMISGPENGGLTNSQGAPELQQETIKVESNISSDSKLLTTEESQKQDVGLNKEVPQLSKKEAPALKLDDDREDGKSTKANLSLSESENQREEKFQIDLMAPPPPLRSSPERDVEINFVAGDPKPPVVDAETEAKPVMKEDDELVRMSKEEVAAMEMDKDESQKPAIMRKERDTNLQLDLEKSDRADTSGNGSTVNKRQHQNNIPRQQQQPSSEKNVLSNSVPLPLSVPSWPGGLPPMGYMTSLQGVVSMDGTTVTSAAIPSQHLLFNQPRPKRCATHCYIARNISYHQQIARMNPFWPAAAGSASLYGAKPCNLNVVPSTELHANVPSRAPDSTRDKDHGLAMFPGHIGKDKSSQPTNVDNSQRKQILLQQALPPGAPGNILHGPAFIFPLNQQQAAAAAASVRPGSVKSLPITSSGGSSSASNSAPPNASGTGASAAPPMSFSYPNMPGNETQYLAILQNNAYPFPIPAHVGGPPAYRGAQALPFFNGSYYSSQMLHPSQIQQQQLPPQSQQSQPGHPNTSISSGSSSSQKHAQNQQQKPNTSGGGSGVGGSIQGFPVPKNQPSQPLQLQQQQQQRQQQQPQRQQLQNHNASHPARQIESEMGGEDSPSTADSRLTRTTMNIYGQNFAMPVQMPNFAFMTQASISGTGSKGSHGEKKQAQQHPGSKAAAETSQAFALSFASINGATAATGLDLSSIAHSHHSYQIIAAAQAAGAQQKKNYRVPEEGKTVVDSSNIDEDRKAIGGKIPATVGQSIAFSRSDVSDPSVTALTGNNIIDSSARTLSLGSAASRAAAAINTSAASSQQHLQRNQQQIVQLQKQHQFAARSKTPSPSNGSVYSDNLPSGTTMGSKFSNAVSAFPQNLVQSSISVAQSPQWKNSAKASTSQSPSSMASPPPSSVKTLPQQQGRTQQAHTQISFAANPKSSAVQVQPSSSAQSPSPPVVVGSPTTSSMSKNTGSPRTTSTSTNNKVSHTSLASQQAKNSQAVPSCKSSPVGGRNVPSILSGPQLTPSSSSGGKPQQQQQQIPKQTLPQAQLFFSNPYINPQVSQSNSSTPTASAANGYYLQRRGPEQMQRQSSSGTSSSNGAAVNNTKSGGLSMPGLLHAAQFSTMPPSGNHHPFVPAGFPYVHPVPTTVQVKPAEQKQPAVKDGVFPMGGDLMPFMFGAYEMEEANLGRP